MITLENIMKRAQRDANQDRRLCPIGASEAYAAFWDDYDWRSGPIEAGSELDALRRQFPDAWRRFLAALASEEHIAALARDGDAERAGFVAAIHPEEPNEDDLEAIA